VSEFSCYIVAWLLSGLLCWLYLTARELNTLATTDVTIEDLVAAVGLMIIGPIAWILLVAVFAGRYRDKVLFSISKGGGR
jgi:hypothetical protein